MSDTSTSINGPDFIGLPSALKSTLNPLELVILAVLNRRKRSDPRVEVKPTDVVLQKRAKTRHKTTLISSRRN